MKKILIGVTAIAALASCSKNETENFSNQNQRVINFTNLNDKVISRAANDASSDYQVYAKWSGGTSGWYIDDVINGSGANADKPQNGPYHWPTSGSVDFYAWAPATVTATAVYPNISIAYSVPSGANEDFTIAAPRTGMTANTVAFQFSHMLSKISISVALTQELTDAGYSLAFTGTANLEVNSTGGTIDPTVASPAWTSPNTTTAAYTGALSYMILPQASTGCKIQIPAGVTITKGGNTVFTGGLSQYTIATNNITGNQFLPGKHYQLIMTISSTSTEGGGGNIFGDEILFSSSVTGWDTITPDPVLPQP